MGETRDGLRQGFTVIDGERSASLSAELFVAEFPGGTSTVLIQGSADDFERGNAGFEHVLASLKWTRPAPDREIPTIDIIAPPNAEGKPDLEKATVVVNQGGAASKRREERASPLVKREQPKAVERRLRRRPEMLRLASVGGSAGD